MLIVCVLISASPVKAQGEAPQVENLAFKILQKQAADYELALSNLITEKLSKYIPGDRFHLSVRIFWNPHKINELQTKNKELKAKATKLPGFPVFVREEQKGLDYYLGAGSVMKLRVEVLIDEKLPKRYTEFIYQMVPIQARFVAERGDTVIVTPIPFPEASEKRKEEPDKDVPLVSDDATAALMESIDKGKKSLEELQPVIVHPVLQRYIADYEKHVKAKLDALVGNYIEKKNYLLDVKFFWNPDELNKLKTLVTKKDTEGKVKLPGFTIYIEERESLYDMMANSVTLMRMEISLMLDEQVSPEVEPFMQKLIPMSIKFLPQRGDQLIIFRGHFPKLGDDLREALSRKSDKSIKSDIEYENEITHAFYSGEYRRALVLLDLLLAKKTDPYERLPLLKKKGSLHLLLNEKELARAAWEQVRRINPDSTKTIEFLNHLDQ